MLQGTNTNYSQINGDTPQLIEEILDAVTSWDHDRQRFSGTATVKEEVVWTSRGYVPAGDPQSWDFWGGWMDNALFIAESAETSDRIRFGWVGSTTLWYNEAGSRIDYTNVNHPLHSAFQSGLVYRGQAVTTDGTWGTASLSLDSAHPLDVPYTSPRSYRRDDPFRWDTAALSLDFTADGGPRVNFPAVFVGITGGTHPDSPAGTPRTTGPVYQGQLSTPEIDGEFPFPYNYKLWFEGFGARGQTPREIAGTFERIHSRPDWSRADRSRDLYGAFGVTRNP